MGVFSGLIKIKQHSTVQNRGDYLIPAYSVGK